MLLSFDDVAHQGTYYLWCLYLWESPIYTLKLSQKFDFSSTRKLDNRDHPIIKTGQIWPLGGFKGGFVFFKYQKVLIRFKKSKLIHFKLEKYETSINFFLKCNLYVTALLEY